MVGRSGDPEESPRSGGGAADRLRQFIDEHFDPHERPEPLPEAVQQGDDNGGAADDGEPLEDDRDSEEQSE